MQFDVFYSPLCLSWYALQNLPTCRLLWRILSKTVVDLTQVVFLLNLLKGKFMSFQTCLTYFHHKMYPLYCCISSLLIALCEKNTKNLFYHEEWFLGELFIKKRHNRQFRHASSLFAWTSQDAVKILSSQSSLQSVLTPYCRGQRDGRAMADREVSKLSRPKTDMEISQRLNSSYSCRCSFSSLYSSHRQKQPGFLW